MRRAFRIEAEKDRRALDGQGAEPPRAQPAGFQHAIRALDAKGRKPISQTGDARIRLLQRASQPAGIGAAQARTIQNALGEHMRKGGKAHPASRASARISAAVRMALARLQGPLDSSSLTMRNAVWARSPRAPIQLWAR